MRLRESNHAAHEWVAHGISDVCHDVKSAVGVVGVQILTDPSVRLVSLPKGSDDRPADVGLFLERHKIQTYDEGVRNAAGMLRFVPFAVSELGSLAPHAEAFLVELAKASHTHTGQKVGQLLFAWRRRSSLLINMAHADNVLGGSRRRARYVMAAFLNLPRPFPQSAAVDLKEFSLKNLLNNLGRPSRIC
eukprot:jgi/Tetstr1/420948/TSEL_012008.t1